MLLLDTSRIPYGESNDTIRFDLERSKSRSLRFWSIMFHKGAELGHMLLLNINRKAYMGSPFGAITFDLSDLQRSMLRPPMIFESFYIRQRSWVRPHVSIISNVNRKAYEESNNTVTFGLSLLERPMSRSIRFWKLISRTWSRVRQYATIKH